MAKKTKERERPRGGDKHWLDAPEWWKKWKPLRWIAVITIIVGITSGLWSGVKVILEPEAHVETEAFTAGVKNPIALMDFKSYSKVDDATARLTAAGLTWTQKRNHRQPNPEFPPRDLDSLIIEGYTHLGVTGNLTLKFFNDRLYEAEFIPDNAEAYSGPFRKAVPNLARDRIGKGEVISGALRVASNVDLARSAVGQSLHTQPYAIFQDLRLVKQQADWDTRFGSIPYKAAANNN